MITHIQTAAQYGLALGLALTAVGAAGIIRGKMLTVNDATRLAEILKILSANTNAITYVTILGEPWSKKRPKFTRRGNFASAYQPHDDKQAEEKTAYHLIQAIPEPFTGNIAIAAIFYQSTRTAHDYDNLLKHVGDAGNNHTWKDDSQITAGAAIMELDWENPRTVLAIAPHSTTLKRGTDNTTQCHTCHKQFSLEKKPPTQKYCSNSCATKRPRKQKP